MKKLILKLATAIVLVALLVTGVVLSVSATNGGVTQYEYKTTGTNKENKENHVNNLLFFSGTRLDNNGASTNLWGNGNTGTLTAPPSDMSFWPTYGEDGSKTDGASLWIDFEFYYDANVKATTYLRLRSYQSGTSTAIMTANFASLSNGVFKWATGYFNNTYRYPITTGGDSVTLPSYGWHHLALRFTQTAQLNDDESATVETLTIDLYLNGEKASSTTVGSAWLDAAADMGLFNSKPNADMPDGIEYTAKTNDLKFCFYGTNQFGYDDGRLVMIRNLFTSCGDTPRVDYAPVKVLGSGVTAFAPDSTIKANDHIGYTSAHAGLEGGKYYDLEYKVSTWKNFYDVKDAGKTLALPELLDSATAYYDANYYRPCSTVTLGETVYIRKVETAFPAEMYGQGTLYKDNKVTGVQTGIQRREFVIGPKLDSGAPLWLELDVYSDPRSSVNFEFRLSDSDAYKQALEEYNKAEDKTGLTEPQTHTYKKALFTVKSDVLVLNSTFFGGGKSVSLGGAGWHRVALKYEQIATYASGTVTNTYRVTVYIDGEQALSNYVLSTQLANFNKHHFFLYETAYDEAAGKITYKANSNLSAYYFSSSLLTATEQLYGFGDVSVGYGANALSEVYSINYQLSGGSLMSSTIDGWALADGGMQAGVAWTFFPLDKNGNAVTFATQQELDACTRGSYEAYQYAYADAKHYRAVGSAYVLPIPVKEGQTFLGWYDNASFEGEAITRISAEQAGAVTLYARFAGGNVTVWQNGETVDAGYQTSYMLPEIDGKWLIGDVLYDGGETLLITGDVVAYGISVSLLDGASIRLDSAASGIRFETEVAEALLAKLTELGYGFKIGTVITPTDLLKGEFTAEALAAAGTMYVELTSLAEGVTLDTRDGNAVFHAALVNLYAQNYTRAFSAVSFLELTLGDKTLRVYSDYSEKDNSRSIYEIAKAAYADTAYGYSAGQLAIIKSFIDGVLVLDADLRLVNEVTANGYASPYTVSYEGGVITVTKPADQVLATIVISGESYTGGWQISDNKTTVTAVFTAE